MKDGYSLRVVAVIQARVGSSRLPGKVLSDLGGRPVLEWVVRAARAALGVDQVVIATSTEPADDDIVNFGMQHGVEVVRGSENDVLSRFIWAAQSTNADAVVRLTSDCPLLDPAVIAQVISVWRHDPDLDYVSTTKIRTLPRGLDVELATSGALARANERTESFHRSHVTSALYEDGAGFACASLIFSPASANFRVTLDTPDDASLLNEVVALLPDKPPRWRDVVGVLQRRPDIVALNAHIEQKTLSEG